MGGTMYNPVQRNQLLLRNNRDKFRQVFGVTLQSYMHPLLGFDIVAFDRFLKVPDGTSTANFITEKYGKDACEMVRGFIG